MNLLKACLIEGRRLKKSGYKPRFRGDTGINVAKLMIDNNIKPRSEWDKAFVETYKSIKA